MIQGINFINTFASIGMFLGITLSIFLLIKKSKKNQTNLFLGLMILFFTITILPSYLYGARLLVYAPHTIRLYSIFSFALGPLIYFYVQSCTQEDFKIKPMDGLHCIPVLLGILQNLSFLTLSGGEKYKLFLKFIETGHWPVSKLGLLILVIYTCIYCFLAARKIMLYRKHINETSSYIDVTYHRWLLFFVIISFFPILILSLLVLFGFQYVTISLVAFSMVFFIISTYLATLYKPSLFHAFPNQVNVLEEQEAIIEQEKQKYENSNLPTVEKDSLSQKLLRHIETEKSFMQPELTLRELAKQIDTRPYHLSQVINETMNTSFLDFINQHRIEEAKNMLHDHQFEHYTIVAIAFEAGFNSKSAFYNAFKKFTDTTPSKYRKLAQIS